jgi:hypothetical protein
MPEAIYNTSVYFNNTYDDDWITTPMAKKMIKRIDKSEVLDVNAIKSPVLGIIPPTQLSGGVKTLLLILNEPDKVFNASNCGDNCAGTLLEIARDREVTVNLRHVMDFGKRKFSIHILNTDEIVHNMLDFLIVANNYV